MQFGDIIGHEKVKEQLISAVQMGKIPHAQLFLGKEGNGHLGLCLAYIQFLLCESPLEADSCGSCRTCRLSEKLIHPNVHFSFPFIRQSETSESQHLLKEWRAAVLEHPYLSFQDWKQMISDGKAPIISAYECRKMIEKLSLKAFENTKKILVIWVPELLGKEGNILLKLIEEPPADTVILLVGYDDTQILNTILSRTQLVKTNALTDNEVKTKIAALNPTISDQLLDQVTHLADGNLNIGLKLVAKTADTYTQQVKQFLGAAFRRKPADVLNWSLALAKETKEDQKNLLQYLGRFLRETVVLHINTQYLPMVIEEEVASSKYLARQLDIEQLSKLAGCVEEAHYHLERNANTKILYTTLAINAGNIVHKIPVV